MSTMTQKSQSGTTYIWSMKKQHKLLALVCLTLGVKGEGCRGGRPDQAPALNWANNTTEPAPPWFADIQNKQDAQKQNKWYSQPLRADRRREDLNLFSCSSPRRPPLDVSGEKAGGITHITRVQAHKHRGARRRVETTPSAADMKAALAQRSKKNGTAKPVDTIPLQTSLDRHSGSWVAVCEGRGVGGWTKDWY